VEKVNVSVRHGCSLRLRQIRATEANEIPSWTPSNRTDQWATPRCPGGRSVVGQRGHHNIDLVDLRRPPEIG
jgi:hypothetical protein